MMTRTVEATYEHNVLKPIKPIECIKEHERVTVILCSHPIKKGIRELAGTLTYEEAEVMQKLIDKSSRKLKASGRLSVDINAVITYIKGIPTVCTLIEGADILLLHVVVLGELLYGALNSVKPQKKEQVTHKFSAQSIPAPIDDAIAIRSATECLQLKKIGRHIPENNIRVAATCLELGVPLLTREGHFTTFMV